MVTFKVAGFSVILCALLANTALSCTLFSVGKEASLLPYCLSKENGLQCYETSQGIPKGQGKLMVCGPAFTVNSQRYRACVKGTSVSAVQSRLSKCQHRMVRTATQTSKVPRSILRSSVAKRLLETQFSYPFIEYITDSQYHPEIVFYGFPVQPKLPDAPVLVTNWTAALNSTVYNKSFTLGSNNGYGFNYGRFNIPVNASEIQLQFDDSCLFPIVVRSTNGSSVNFQLSRFSSNVYDLRVINGEVHGPLGYQNAPNTHLNYYLNSSTADARANGLYSVVAKFFPGYEYAGSALYIYCPLKASDATVVNFQATYSNMFLTPNVPVPQFNGTTPNNGTNNTTNNGTNNNNTNPIVDNEKDEESNHLGLILGLVLGIGIPLLLLILGLIIYCCCCRNRNQQQNVVVEAPVRSVPGETVRVSREELVPVDDIKGGYAVQAGDEQVIINQRNYGEKIEKTGAVYAPTFNTLETEHRPSALPSSSNMLSSNTLQINSGQASANYNAGLARDAENRAYTLQSSSNNMTGGNTIQINSGQASANWNAEVARNQQAQYQYQIPAQPVGIVSTSGTNYVVENPGFFQSGTQNQVFTTGSFTTGAQLKTGN